MGVYHFSCGHHGSDGTWSKGTKQLDALCAACRDARIGDVIPFVRHGQVPSGGASRNHRDGTAEAGVSVYEVVAGETKYCGWHFDIAERPVYRGTGRIVGWGSDGEPLVQILILKKGRK